MVAHPRRGGSQVTQRYFWGSHSGIGGGKTGERQASQITLRFLFDEMQRRHIPLAIDARYIPSYPAINAPEPREDDDTPTLRRWLTSVVGGAAPREVEFREVHVAAVDRLQQVKEWRPSALRPIENELLRLSLPTKNRW